MPMINIEDAYILGETGAQVDKVTGLFTKDENTTNPEKAFAQLNIGASGGGGGGRNLIDNPFFTINQRGASGAISQGGYVADRWYVRAGAGVSVTHKANGGITITNTTNFDITYLFPFKNTGELNGKTVTISADVNGNITSKTGVIGSGNGYYVSTDGNNGLDIRCGSFSTIKSNLLLINISNSVSGAQLNVDLNAVKLEIGSVSTLANDAPPDYGEELAKCQRYFLRISQSTSNAPMGFGVATSPTSALVTIPIPVTMRSGGTITVTATGATTLRFGSSNVTVTSIAFRNIAPNAIAITANVASGLSGNNVVMFMPDAGYILNISADL